MKRFRTQRPHFSATDPHLGSDRAILSPNSSEFVLDRQWRGRCTPLLHIVSFRRTACACIRPFCRRDSLGPPVCHTMHILDFGKPRSSQKRRRRRSSIGCKTFEPVCTYRCVLNTWGREAVLSVGDRSSARTRTADASLKLRVTFVSSYH